jgi:hypothetical protein
MSTVYRFLRCYAALIFLVATLGIQLIDGTIRGRAPVPQAPAAGHVAYEYSLPVAWAEDGLDPPFIVQVVEAGGSFETPNVELRADQRFTTLPPLEPGREWRWRVVHEATGTVSKESTFRTADYPVNY